MSPFVPQPPPFPSRVVNPLLRSSVLLTIGEAERRDRYRKAAEMAKDAGFPDVHEKLRALAEDEERHSKVLSQALKEALKRELLSEKHNEDRTYLALER
jgi:rubrerythrin